MQNLQKYPNLNTIFNILKSNSSKCIGFMIIASSFKYFSNHTPPLLFSLYVTICIIRHHALKRRHHARTQSALLICPTTTVPHYCRSFSQKPLLGVGTAVVAVAWMLFPVLWINNVGIRRCLIRTECSWMRCFWIKDERI